jgi:hypothetical protein
MSQTQAPTSSDELRDLSRVDRFRYVFDFDPYDYQRDLIEYGAHNDVAKAAVKPGRQVGKTVTGGAIAAERALAGHDVIILGPFEDTVKEMMEAARNHLETAETILNKANIGLGTEQRNKTDWQWHHNGRLRARTVGTDGTQIRGKNPDVVLIDEDAYIKNSIHTEVIEPFFSTHDAYEYYLFSTPAGKSGYFYEKVEHDETFYSPHWPSRISPLIDDAFLEEKEQELDSLTYAQEYQGEFVEDEDSYLPHEIVDPCINPDAKFSRTEPRWLGVDPAEKGKDEMVIYDIGESGYTHNIWSKETVTGPDFVGFLTELHTERTLPTPDVGHGDPPKRGFEQIVVESNMAGLATDILEAGLGSVVLPVKSTTKSKGPMYKRLKRDLEAGELVLPNHRKLINQTTSLQYSYTRNQNLQLSHPPNGHDDYPDALMLANAGRTGVAQNYKTDIEGSKTGQNVPLAW